MLDLLSHRWRALLKAGLVTVPRCSYSSTDLTICICGKRIAGWSTPVVWPTVFGWAKWAGSNIWISVKTASRLGRRPPHADLL